MDKQTQQKIIEAAIQAPSADNSQPFLYRWQGEAALSLYLDETLCGNATDKSFILSDLAIGAVLESVLLQAATLGYKATYQLFPQGEQQAYHIADIAFIADDQPVNEQTTRLAAHIYQRHTDRRFPFHGQITDEHLQQLQHILSSPHCKMYGYNRPDKIKTIIPTIFQAEKVRFEAESLHQELFNTVIFSRTPSPKGMNLDVLGIKKFESAGFKWLSNWKVMRMLNAIGASKQIATKSVKQPISQSPGLLLLATDNTTRTGIIETGQQLQRLWLQCTAMGLAVQLYAAPGVLSLAMPEIPSSLKTVLQQVKDALHQLTDEGFHGVMFFRIGTMPDKPAQTQRRDPASFIKH